MNPRLVLAIAATAALAAACGGGGGRRARKTRPPPAARSRSGTRTTPRRWLGARRWSPTGTRRTPTRRSRARRSRPGKSSEEVIGAAITAGNAPCLVFNTSPAAVPGFQKQGGLVALDELRRAASSTSRPVRGGGQAVRVAGRQVLPAAVEGQPGDDLLQQEALREGRDRRGEAAAGHLRGVPRHVAQARQERRRRRRDLSGADRASSTSRGSTSTRCSSPTPGKQLVEDGKAQFDSPEGKQVAELLEDDVRRQAWRRKEKYNGDAFADGRPRWRSSARGRSRSTGTRSTGASPRCRRPRASRPARSRRSPTRSRRDVQRLQEPRHGVGRPEVRDLQGAGRRVPERPGRCRCARTWSRPTRSTSTRTRVHDVRRQAARTVEVPNVPNSVTIWQTFRDAYSKSVIFGKEPGRGARRRRRQGRGAGRRKGMR